MVIVAHHTKAPYLAILPTSRPTSYKVAWNYRAKRGQRVCAVLRHSKWPKGARSIYRNSRNLIIATICLCLDCQWLVAIHRHHNINLWTFSPIVRPPNTHGTSRQVIFGILYSLLKIRWGQISWFHSEMWVRRVLALNSVLYTKGTWKSIRLFSLSLSRFWFRLLLLNPRRWSTVERNILNCTRRSNNKTLNH